MRPKEFATLEDARRERWHIPDASFQRIDPIETLVIIMQHYLFVAAGFLAQFQMVTGNWRFRTSASLS